jgi:hypothetical protein
VPLAKLWASGFRSSSAGRMGRIHTHWWTWLLAGGRRPEPPSL